MKYNNRPFYEAKYKMELAIELTGKTAEALRKMMTRKSWTLAETIKSYIKKDIN